MFNYDKKIYIDLKIYFVMAQKKTFYRWVAIRFDVNQIKKKI